MKKTIYILTATFMLLFGSNKLQAQCSIGNIGAGFTGSYSLPDARYSLGESFVATCSGLLTAITVNTTIPNVSQSGNITIYNGAGGSVITSQVYSSSTIANGNLDVQLPNPIAVTAGNTYTFLVSCTPGTILRYNNSTYSGGSLFYISAGPMSSISFQDLLFNVNITGTCTPTTSITNAAICAGGSYSFNGTSYNTVGTYTAHLTNAAGCDSAATLNLSLVSGGSAATGSGLNFDGANDYISVDPSSAFETVNNTVELWVKPTGNTTENPCMVSVRDAFDTRYSYHLASDNSRIYLWNGGALGLWNYNFTPGQWYHIAFVQNGSNTEAFVNGVSIGTQPVVSSSAAGLGLNIGTASANATEEFYGNMDELRIWSSARTQSQIQANMNNELVGNEAGLVAYYNFNAGSGNVLADKTGHNHTGTLHNFALTGATSNWYSVAPPFTITGASAVCVGGAVTLSNAAVTGGVWSSLNNRATVNATTGVVTGASQGTASIKYAYTAGGCNLSATTAFAVNSLPNIPSIQYAAGTVNPQYGVGGSYCANKTFTVVGTPSGGTWSSTGFANVNSTTGVLATGSSTGAATLTYTYTNGNGCSNSRTIVGSVTVCSHRGVNAASGEKMVASGDFTMYPNPAKSFISLNVTTLIGAGSIVVTDLYGKQVKNQTLSIGTNTMDVSSFAKGIYLVSMITNEGKITKKLVVE